MPLKIAYRRTYSESTFRDAILESLHSHKSGSVYIASGFFSDFLIKEQQKSPDHNLLDALSGKTVYVYGIYNQWRDKAAMVSFKKTLVAHDIEARAFICTDKWHAKTLLFFSENKPLLGIVGSSNTTGPSFAGYNPFGNWFGNPKHTVECDSYFWTSAVDTAMRYAFGDEAKLRKCYLSTNAVPDHEIETIIHELLEELQQFSWDELK